MKSILTTLLLFIGLNASFAQNVAIVKHKADLVSIKESGKGMITLPNGLSADDVASKAKYYTHYFTVQYDEASHVATFTMVENDERGRAIITRFLTACEVQQINIEGTIIERDSLFEKYLR